MAQPLESRVTAALRDRARLQDIEQVIADVKAEIVSVQARLDAETARSVDPELTTAEAREARNSAADFEHDLRRLNASLGMLQEKCAQILSRSKEAERQARYDAAKAERDELAALIHTRYPALALEIMRMVQRIQANDTDVASVNQDRPNGAVELLPAEQLARGNIGLYWRSGAGAMTPCTGLKSAQLPLLHAPGAYLPLVERTLGGDKARWEALIATDQEFSQQPLASDEDLIGELHAELARAREADLKRHAEMMEGR